MQPTHVYGIEFETSSENLSLIFHITDNLKEKKNKLFLGNSIRKMKLIIWRNEMSAPDYQKKKIVQTW